jgi:predicted permease
MSIGSSLVSAARSIRRAPKFTAIVVFVFAISMGGAIAGYSAVKALLLEPLPYREPGSLVRVGHVHAQRGVLWGEFSPQDLEDLRRGAGSYASLAPHFSSAEDVVIAERPFQLEVTYFSPEFFPTLGTAPMLGRVPAADERDAVVLSHRAWRTHFAGDPGVVDRTLATAGMGTLRIVGVMPPSFEFPLAGIDAWFPIALIGEDDIPKQRDVRWLDVVARLAPGATLEAARAETDAIVAGLAREHGESNAGFDRAAVEPMKQQLVANERAPVLALFVATLLLLALASVNVANLMIARGARRQREIAVRGALGASRGTLGAQVVLEAMLLALAGAALGLALAKLALSVFGQIVAGRIARLSAIDLDPAIVFAALAMALVTGALVGAWPAWRSSRADAARTLGRATAGAQGRGEVRLRGALVVAQVALVGALGYAASLLGGSIANLARVELGIDADSVATFAVRLSSEKYESGGARTQARLALLDAVRAVPGVRAAASAKTRPIGGAAEPFTWSLPSDPKRQLPVEWGSPFVSGGYFEALGVPVLRGRSLADREDTSGGAVPVVVNEAFVARFLAGREAIGEELVLLGEHRASIVGVVGNVRHAGPRMPEAPAVYLPSSSIERSLVTVVARVDRRTPEMLEALRRAVASVAPEVPVTDLEFVDEQVAAMDARAHWLARALAVFAAFGALLGAIGIFSVLSYVVALRSRELALKLAIGAHPAALARGVLRQSLWLALVGSALAIPLGIAAARVVRALLHGVEPASPVAIASTIFGVILLALAAAALPARRAARTEPMVALRSE